MSEKESPDPSERDDEGKQDDLASKGWRYSFTPPKTGAQRQKAYERTQSEGDKKRPGWWLSEEVIKTITNRQWEHPYLVPDKRAGQSSRRTKSGRIDTELRYMLRIVEAVEAKIRETGYMDPEKAIDLVLEKIAALEVPYVSFEARFPD